MNDVILVTIMILNQDSKAYGLLLIQYFDLTAIKVIPTCFFNRITLSILIRLMPSLIRNFYYWHALNIKCW